ncbi:hypothetical protein [Spirosoma koreense]
MTSRVGSVGVVEKGQHAIDRIGTRKGGNQKRDVVDGADGRGSS